MNYRDTDRETTLQDLLAAAERAAYGDLTDGKRDDLIAAIRAMRARIEPVGRTEHSRVRCDETLRRGTLVSKPVGRATVVEWDDDDDEVIDDDSMGWDEITKCRNESVQSLRDLSDVGPVAAVLDVIARSEREVWSRWDDDGTEQCLRDLGARCGDLDEVGYTDVQNTGGGNWMLVVAVQIGDQNMGDDYCVAVCATVEQVFVLDPRGFQPTGDPDVDGDSAAMAIFNHCSERGYCDVPAYDWAPDSFRQEV